MTCLAIGRIYHGKWKYWTVVTYVAMENKEGYKVWRKGETIAEATTVNKINGLASEYASKMGVALLPHVRHNDPVL